MRNGQRTAGLEQQLRCNRSAPVGLIEADRPEMEREARFGSAAQRANRAAQAIVGHIREEVELVFLRRLPRHTNGFRFVPLRAIAGT